MESIKTLKKETLSFSSKWWDDFLTVSKNMSKPSIFKDCLTKEETFFMRKCILEIFQDLAELRTTRHGYRVYNDKAEEFDAQKMGYLYDNPPKNNETLEEWWYRIFGEQNIGILVYQGERFNLKLSKLIAEKIEPLLIKTGIPVEGISFTLFIGNYESTPLGIHIDDPGKNVMHFHLGPGSKTIYTWEDAKTYKEMAGENSQNNKDYKKYLPYATKSTFSEGDFFTMPEDTFHIGTQEGLSIGIACWRNNRSKHLFADELLNILVRNYLKGGTDFLDRDPKLNLSPDTNPLKDASFISETLDLYEFPKEYEHLTFKEILKNIYRDLRYIIHSNAGFRTSPFPKSDEDSILDKNDVLVQETPFKILYRESNDKEKLFVYARGHKLSLNNFDCICSMIDQINIGKKIEIPQLLKELDPDWPDEVGLHILGLLYQNHGIIKIN
ncbi:hypothetical protein [Aquimarina algiphila]|uniref:hypothetical protein n=1 Tax=Aquimarina algiphila TaxID=2047982 RepID=UPI00232CA480|nr:hypothetical protein [Aquimarina algiphila]